MIYIEIPKAGMPVVAYEMTDASLFRITAIQAFRRRQPLPYTVDEAVAYMRATLAELHTFHSWDDAEAWADSVSGWRGENVLAAITRSRRFPGCTAATVAPVPAVEP